MDFNIISTKDFDSQFNSLNEKYMELIRNKIILIKENPYRFKALTIKRHKLFRVRLNINKKETRLIYKIIEPNIILICLLERKHDYNDLKKFLEKI